MPTFDFTDEEINTLITYFNALSEETYPFETYPDVRMTSSEQRDAERLVGREYFNCFICHQQGSGGGAIEGPASQWAPNLGLASGRLKPQWIMDWIRNPQVIQPGTRMPTYYDPNEFDTSGPPDIHNTRTAKGMTVANSRWLKSGRSEAAFVLGSPRATR